MVNAFEYLAKPVTVIKDEAGLSKVDKIVLPGVGAFGMGMKHLTDMGMVDALNQEVLVNRKPFLGICLGMQLICKESFEFGHFDGLGWVDASVRKLKAAPGLAIPHVGWDDLKIKRQNCLLRGENGRFPDVYFVHSYYADPVDPGVVTAVCDYGMEFPAAIEKDNIFAVQFHPEKSQKAGLDMLKEFSEAGTHA